MKPADTPAARRHARLRRLQVRLEIPMIVLAFVWLALFVAEAVWGVRPWMQTAGYVIWAVFALEFALGWLLAPDRGTYLRHNLLKAVALLAPALRLLRIARVARVARAARLVRGTRLVRVLSSINRGMGALGSSMGRRGGAYVIALTALVTLAGAAGMYVFENERSGAGGFAGFGDALWWTAMIMTTMGSAYWPVTAAGRVLCLLLSLYAFAVFGYVTAAIASFFVGRDRGGDAAGNEDLRALRDEVAALRAALEGRSTTPPAGPGGGDRA